MISFKNASSFSAMSDCIKDLDVEVIAFSVVKSQRFSAKINFLICEVYSRTLEKSVGLYRFLIGHGRYRYVLMS